MNTHWLRWASLIGFVLTLALVPQPSAAQTAKRWLADPALIVPVKTIGPNGGRSAEAGIGDIALWDQQHGWATYAYGLLRFDGRFWHPEQRLSSFDGIGPIALTGPSEGWVGGSSFVSGGPTAIFLAHFTADDLTRQNIVRSDGSDQPLTGYISDLAALPDGTAWAIGTHVTVENTWGRPLMLFFDGTRWIDRSPSTWPFGQLTKLSIVSATEGWATGILGRPGGTGTDAARPAMLHYQNGTWSEAALPPLPIGNQPFSMSNLTMRDASEGWAIFYDAGTRCPFTELLHYTNGSWSVVPRASYGDQSITAFAIIPGTSRGWATQSGCRGREPSTPDQRLRVDGGTFTPDSGGAQLAPNIYALLSDEVQWAAAGGAIMRFSAETLPTDRVAGAQPGTRFFATTGHTLGGVFRQYYESHGLDLGERGTSDREALALFGYPVSEPFSEINPDTGEVLQVQYFERARLEYHPANPDPYKVLLGRLGFQTLLRQRDPSVLGAQPSEQTPTPLPGCDRFVESGFDLCPPLKAFWYGNGGLPVFGFPIVQARNERSQTDGQIYLTQWVERERLEYHPENAGTPYEVLLGLLGAEELRVRGYLPAN